MNFSLLKAHVVSCVFSFAYSFFSLLKDTRAADRWVIVTLSGEIKILVQTELGAELGKVEFRGIFTGRCVCKVLEICCCVFLYCMSKKATLIYIPKTLVTPDVNKILLVKKPIHFIERGHVTWKKNI